MTPPERTFEYKSSHPWLRFDLNLISAGPGVWIDLGEAASKCEHIAGVALDPDMADELQRIYMAKGTHATTAIEGNTLTEQQVLQLYDRKLQLPPSQEYLAQEVGNVINAANSIIDAMVSGKSDQLSVEKIESYNAMILKELRLQIARIQEFQLALERKC